MSAAPIRVEVPLPERAYDVVVGHGAISELAGLVPPTARRAALVTQPGLPFAGGANGALGGDLAIEHRVFEIGRGEAHKTMTSVETLCRGFAEWGLTRNDVVIGVGGGLVTDVAGFAAAVYHRGVPVVHVATTLLGMVDAAIGGKTGVNLPEGKNLVGAFWQPVGVICDLDALATLPPRELACGRGEMAKYHFLTGEDLLALDLPERVARCAAIKAAAVVGDERESIANGRGRARLNYGHTLGHALERAGDYELRHGEAVAIGLVYAAELAHALGRIDGRRVDRHREVVAAYGLPTALPEWADPAELIELIGRDKKAVAGITFVLDGVDGPEVVAGIDREPIEAAFARMERR